LDEGQEQLGLTMKVRQRSNQDLRRGKRTALGKGLCKWGRESEPAGDLYDPDIGVNGGWEGEVGGKEEKFGDGDERHVVFGGIQKKENVKFCRVGGSEKGLPGGEKKLIFYSGVKG